MTIAPTPKNCFATVNDVRLQYLDWGGEGPAMIFLAGSANTPHFFSGLASRFGDRFRILGLTRRGHGESEQPESGYDVAMLASDVVGFMDAIEVERAILVGHSFAGREMAFIGARYPDRVTKLVFLDALYEYIEEDVPLFAANPVPPAPPPPESFASVAEYCEDFVNRYPAYRPLRSPTWDAWWAMSLRKRDDGRFVEKMRPETAQQMFGNMVGYQSDLAAIRCPVLAVFAYQSADWIMPSGASDALRRQVVAYAERMNREFKDRNLARARDEIQNATILVLEDTSHYCFLDKEDVVADAMEEFLAP
jgi:non-heme chloroperoxidase